MIEVEIGNVAGECFRIDEPRIRVFGREAGRGAGFLDGVADGLLTEVSRAGRALALAEVDSDSESPVPLILDGLDFAQTRRDAQTLVDARIAARLGSPPPRRLLEHETDNIL